MATTSAFTVTCPSNNNMDKYPKNVGSNYIVGLANPLSFSGQSLNEDVRWQVSMLSLHYTQNICNFREASILRIIIDKPADVNVAETASASSRDADDATLDWSAVTDLCTGFILGCTGAQTRNHGRRRDSEQSRHQLCLERSKYQKAILRVFRHYATTSSLDSTRCSARDTN